MNDCADTPAKTIEFIIIHPVKTLAIKDLQENWVIQLDSDVSLRMTSSTKGLPGVFLCEEAFLVSVCEFWWLPRPLDWQLSSGATCWRPWRQQMTILQRPPPLCGCWLHVYRILALVADGGGAWCARIRPWVGGPVPRSAAAATRRLVDGWEGREWRGAFAPCANLPCGAERGHSEALKWHALRPSVSALHFHNFAPLVGSGPEIIAACGMCALLVCVLIFLVCWFLFVDALFGTSVCPTVYVGRCRLWRPSLGLRWLCLGMHTFNPPRCQ